MIAVLDRNCPLRDKARVVQLIESEGLRVQVSETATHCLVGAIGAQKRAACTVSFTGSVNSNQLPQAESFSASSFMLNVRASTMITAFPSRSLKPSLLNTSSSRRMNSKS